MTCVTCKNIQKNSLSIVGCHFTRNRTIQNILKKVYKLKTDNSIMTSRRKKRREKITTKYFSFGSYKCFNMPENNI